MSDYLFARPCWLHGIARLLDLGATFDEYNDSNTGQEADARAIYSDWLSVGKDIKSAIDQHNSLMNKRVD